MQRRDFLISVSAVLAGQVAVAAPSADLWERWTQHAPGTSTLVDHGVWDRALRRHRRVGADGIARLDYPQLHRDGSEVDQYMSQLTQVKVSELDRPEQMAFWINLYNALTVAVVLDHWPVASIRDIDISPGLFSNGPWGAKLTSVEGVDLSLDDIEHRILRPIWRDARVHYAVNCASLGCPDIAPTAFTSGSLEAMLEAAATTYINHPRGVTARNGRVTVSKIYDWFQEDFGGSERGVLAHLVQYARPDLAAALSEAGQIDGYAYDWSLNAVTVSG